MFWGWNRSKNYVDPINLLAVVVPVKPLKNDYDAPEGESFDELYQTDSLRWMSVVVVMLVVLGFFSLAWYAYRTSTSPALESGDLMVVEAESSPYKEAPEDPGGMQFPDQDKEVYNSLISGEEKDEQEEHLSPMPEEPMTKKGIAERLEEEAAKEAEKSGETASWVNKELHPETTLNETGTAPEAAKEQPNPEAAKEEIPAQKEPDKKEAPVDVAGKEESRPAKAEIPAYKPEKPVVKPWMPAAGASAQKAPEIKKPEPDAIVAQAEQFTKERAAPVKPVATAPAPAPASAPVATGGGTAEVQLGALRSHQEAEGMWQRLAARHGDVLGGKAHRVVMAEIPGKGVFYRLRVGVGSAAAGSSICSTLQRRSQACLLVR
jgi:hypothetical protein